MDVCSAVRLSGFRALAYSILVRVPRCQNASNRVSPRRQELLLSPLWGTLFGDAFATFQERKQRRKMYGLPANHGQVGFN